MRDEELPIGPHWTIYLAVILIGLFTFWVALPLIHEAVARLPIL